MKKRENDALKLIQRNLHETRSWGSYQLAALQSSKVAIVSGKRGIKEDMHSCGKEDLHSNIQLNSYKNEN